MPSSISLDLRKRILKVYDQGGVTRDDVAKRFDVSLGMVKKLLRQRRELGDIRHQHHRSGRKPKILESHCREMERLLDEKPDMTLEDALASCMTLYQPVPVRDASGTVLGTVHPQDLAKALQVERE